MKNYLCVLTAIFFCFSNSYSQKNPDLILSNDDESKRSLIYFYEDQFKKVSGYIFINCQIDFGDSVTTDTLYISFVATYKIVIRKISFSKKGNGMEYCSVDSFPDSDSLNWKFVGELNQRDSLSLNDSLLIIKSEGGTVLWRLGKEYVFHRGDTLKLLLDTLPIYDRVPIQNKLIKPLNRLNNHNKHHLFLNHDRYCSPLDIHSHQDLFNLAGKKQYILLNRGLNIYIIKSK